MLGINLLFFIIIAVLGIVGNIQAFRTGAPLGWNVWFWNIVWVMSLRATWPT